MRPTVKADTSHIADKRTHLLHNINRKWRTCSPWARRRSSPDDIAHLILLRSNKYRVLVGLFNSTTEVSNILLLFSVRVLASLPLAMRVLGSLSLALRCALYFSSYWWVVRTNVGTITWWSTRCRNHESNVSFYQSLQHFLQSLWRLNTFLTNWHSLQVYNAAAYSASADDNATIFRFLAA